MAPLQDCCFSAVWRAGEQGSEGDHGRAKLLVTARCTGGEENTVQSAYTAAVPVPALTFSLGRKVWWELTAWGKQESLSVRPRLGVQEGGGSSKQTFQLPFHFLPLCRPRVLAATIGCREERLMSRQQVRKIKDLVSQEGLYHWRDAVQQSCKFI